MQKVELTSKHVLAIVGLAAASAIVVILEGLLRDISSVRKITFTYIPIDKVLIGFRRHYKMHISRFDEG
jgi:hypothetical protein